jgi:lipid II:glycine glycyltransferase (peptidoglycan interpeptide bridge formation enzyme)
VVSSTNKTDRHDITEILLKVALNTIKQTVKQQTEFFMKITPFLKSNIIIDQTTNIVKINDCESLERIQSGRI